MSCQTCDHTMQCIFADLPRIFWCPRCGSIKSDMGTHEEPKLIERVIEFAGHLTDEHQDLIDTFERLGIRESITTIPM